VAIYGSEDQALSLFAADGGGSGVVEAGERPAFLREQLITYIGNKRSLLPLISTALDEVARALGRKPAAIDAFAGSGVVSRLLKSKASLVVSNDLEPYAEVLGRCYLRNEGEVDRGVVGALVRELNEAVEMEPSPDGFIERLYSPDADDDIRVGERVFYTRDNARRLDLYGRWIGELDEEVRPLLLGPLLSAASVHANTAGVFKGFYKDRDTGKGRFGGKGEDALSRIKGTIRLRPPVLSSFDTEFAVLRGDANELADRLPPVDVAYLDPPYNQHPYGSNYFMLNLLVDYAEPGEISRVSGIPADWRRSGYNVKSRSKSLLEELVARLPVRFLLVSFNDEGFIRPDEMSALLAEAGSVKEFRRPYNTYRGSRNLLNRKLHVTEHLYLVDREG
jgi:adenine-specific DNA-methyltransferase